MTRVIFIKRVYARAGTTWWGVGRGGLNEPSRRLVGFFVRRVKRKSIVRLDTHESTAHKKLGRLLWDGSGQKIYFFPIFFPHTGWIKGQAFVFLRIGLRPAIQPPR